MDLLGAGADARVNRANFGALLRCSHNHHFARRVWRWKVDRTSVTTMSELPSGHQFGERRHGYASFNLTGVRENPRSEVTMMLVRSRRVCERVADTSIYR